jgi:hypothetical protein
MSTKISSLTLADQRNTDIRANKTFFFDKTYFNIRPLQENYSKSLKNHLTSIDLIDFNGC